MFIQHVGEITFGDIMDQLFELVASPEFVKGMTLLLDLSQATLPTGYDLSDVKDVIENQPTPLESALRDKRKVGWVLGNARDFKIIHQYCAMTRLSLTIVERQPFRDIASAMEWLGLPKGYQINYPVQEGTTRGKTGGAMDWSR